VLILSGAQAARAEDAFYRVEIQDLQLTDGRLPDWQRADVAWRIRWQLREAMRPYAVLDGDGEIYVAADPIRPGRPSDEADYLAVRAAARSDLEGRLFWPKTDLSGMVALRFTIPATAADLEHRDDFYRAKLAHYQELLRGGVPGAAWFRHQCRQARTALPLDEGEPRVAQWPRWRGRTSELSQTYALFSGGRAMSENLQLDRTLPEPGPSDELVDLDSIAGITIPEIDWNELVGDRKPQLDPLAGKIPFDQHAVFFPSFQAFAAAIDEMKAQSQPVLQILEVRGEDAGTLARYERQLGLSINAAARLLGPRLAKSVAMTGSDPYFRTGTDVAFLFEAVDAGVLHKAIVAQVAASAGDVPHAKPIRGKIHGVRYVGFRSSDRRVSTYVATLGSAVVVTNSPYQLGRLARVHRGRLRPMADLAEYRYFRARYRRGDPEETVFLFLSDATIRRWCGPRWRILTSRRTRDMAVIAELQAAQMDRLARGDFTPGPIYTDLPLAVEGSLTLAPDGVYSETVGSLAFMTPIAELPIQKVTKAEAEAYRRWRAGYERNWTGVFDPIGLRLGIHPDRLTADLTVMPLIGGSEYRQLIAVSRGAKIGPADGDPHDALAHVALAVNKNSAEVKRFGSLAMTVTGLARIDPLDWLGSTVALYFDDDPFWTELAKVAYDDRDEFFQRNIGRLPVALVVEVENGFKLTAFLAAVRAFIEQTAPGMTQWESLTYRDEPYVKVTPSARAKRQTGELENLVIYYSASGESLILTPSEEVLKRALDRRIARRAAADQPEQSNARQPATSAWLGESLCLKARHKALAMLSALFGEDYQMLMQKRAWANLPILNEWKRRYPDQDPVQLHRRVWKVRLIDPAGGRYRWNAQWRTMESTVYGHPGQPKPGPAAPPVVAQITDANLGITFEEDDGLRARVKLTRRTP